MTRVRAGHTATLLVMVFAVFLLIHFVADDAWGEEEGAAGGAAPAAGAALQVASPPQPAGVATLPPYLADRGRGIATSQFGTYVGKGEWLIYTFYEYTR